MSSLPAIEFRCVAHAVVVAQAQRAPQATALLCRGTAMSYGELDRQSSRMARYLRVKGVLPGDIVGVSLKPAFELVVAILAVWKANAAYLPLECNYPTERLALMIGDAESKFILTHSSLADLFRHSAVNIINIDSELEWINRQSAQPLHEDDLDPDAMAYLMYTSGSTGMPKGVMVSHRALVNKLIHPGTWGRITANCRAAFLTSIAFDASLAQLFLPLTHGGSVVVIEEHDRLEPARVWSCIRAAGVNLLDCTPSWLLAMLDAAPSNLNFNRLVLGGEVLTPSFAQRVQARFPKATLTNIYGPTEACIDALAHEVSHDDLAAEFIPIGRPLPGYQAYLLDAALQPVRAGEVGELYLGGIGIALGYWRNAQASAARFIADPFKPGGRLYCTGDLGRRRADGCIEFLGRADHQIKLRGQRLELGEIETVLARLPEVIAAVVKAWPKHATDEVALVAYIVPRNSVLQPASLYEKLRTQLPAYMVPSEIVLLERLPLLANGKVDRAALPAVTLQARHIDSQHLPRDAMEQTLAEIWREVLHVQAVSVHDNFFALGGDSLSVVRLLLLINERFDTQLPLTALLAHMTIADLAMVLLRQARSGAHDQQSRAIRLSHQPLDRPLLFLLPPITGIGLVYAGLARELTDSTSAVALQAVGFTDTPPGRVSMQQLVGEFIKDIERLQPAGAVRLGGYSAGGVVAHEMIRQLQGIGRSVSHLFLFDPYSADMSNSLIGVQATHDPDAFWSACGDMIWDVMGIRGVAAEPLVQLAQRLWACVQTTQSWDKQAAQLRALTTEAQSILPANLSMEVFLLLLEGLVNLWHAFATHTMTPLQGLSSEIWIIQPDGDDDPELRHARDAQWRMLFGTTIHTAMVPGHHATLLSRAHTVTAIGAHVRRALHATGSAS